MCTIKETLVEFWTELCELGRDTKTEWANLKVWWAGWVKRHIVDVDPYGD